VGQWGGGTGKGAWAALASLCGGAGRKAAALMRGYAGVKFPCAAGCGVMVREGCLRAVMAWRHWERGRGRLLAGLVEVSIGTRRRLGAVMGRGFGRLEGGSMCQRGLFVDNTLWEIQTGFFSLYIEYQ